MKYIEKLSWILDKNDKSTNKDEEYKRNIDFVHSLGLKCDCVGWSDLDLSDPRTDEIFEKIKEFCAEDGWTARGYYEREYIDVQSDWYELIHANFKDSTCGDFVRTTTDEGEAFRIMTIRAYHEIDFNPKERGHSLYVPERFRNFCLDNKISDLDFCWIQDKGKYESEQYFQVYGNKILPKVALYWKLDQSQKDVIDGLGGKLSKVVDVVPKLQRIDLQDCYIEEDFPNGGIVCVNVPQKSWNIGKNTILIHKDIAEKMIEKKIISKRLLKPAPIFKSLPIGYSFEETELEKRPNKNYINEMQKEYEKLKSTIRPIRKISEKDALKTLRKAKKDRKEDFNKGISKQKIESLLNEEYQILSSYYTITNGGYLSDEYRLLSYEEAIIENEEFFVNLEQEELLDEKPNGIVIAKCPDGDTVILRNNGEVIRFSHEVPEAIDTWLSLPQFVFDAVMFDE